MLACPRGGSLRGSLIGTALAVLAGAPNDLVEQGLCSYNSSLTLAAMVLFYVPSIGSILVAMVAVILTVLVQFTLEVLLMPYGLPVMTVLYRFCQSRYPRIMFAV